MEPKPRNDEEEPETGGLLIGIQVYCDPHHPMLHAKLTLKTKGQVKAIRDWVKKNMKYFVYQGMNELGIIGESDELSGKRFDVKLFYRQPLKLPQSRITLI